MRSQSTRFRTARDRSRRVVRAAGAGARRRAIRIIVGLPLILVLNRVLHRNVQEEKRMSVQNRRDTEAIRSEEQQRGEQVTCPVE